MIQDSQGTPAVTISDERVKELHRQMLQERIERAEIPPEYMRYSISGKPGTKIYDVTYNGQIIPSKVQAYEATVNYICNIHENRRQGNGIFLYGPPHQKLGMSLLGSFIIRAAVEEGYSALFVHFPSFCDELDSLYDSPQKARFYDVDFLLVDSISQKSQKSMKVIDGFADVILSRRKENKPTIFASYINPDMLSTLYSPSLISYLDEYVQTLEIKNESASAEIRYSLEKFKNYIRQHQQLNPEKMQYTALELESMLKKFQFDYPYLTD